MTTITLEPRSREAVYQFPLEGEPPVSVLSSDASLCWRARISAISAVPSPVAFARLTSGGLLRDLKGFVSFDVGTATTHGQEVYADRQRWGYFSYRDSPEERFVASLHVSEKMFSCLVELVKAGAIPTIEVTVTDAEGIKTSISDGRLDKWDNVKVPALVILWCEFTATFVGATPPAPEEPPSDEN